MLRKEGCPGEEGTKRHNLLHFQTQKIERQKANGNGDESKKFNGNYPFCSQIQLRGIVVSAMGDQLKGNEFESRWVQQRNYHFQEHK